MGSNLEKAFNYTVDADPLFKIKFLKYYENAFNSATTTWSQIAKNNTFVSKKLEFPVPTTYKGGAGSGTLPESVPATYADVTITSKKVYATDKVDRETILASLGSEAAFVGAMAECIKKVVEVDKWNQSRILFNSLHGGSNTGGLGIADSTITDNGGGDYDVVITAASWKEANWEENQMINFGTGTDKFVINDVTPSTRTIGIQRQSGGTDVPTAADIIYLQGSRGNDPYGLADVLLATSGTYYNVSAALRKWQAYQNAVTVAISTALMNKAMIQVEKRCGKVPDLIVTSATQYEKILNMLEDQKRYSITDIAPKAANLKGRISFKGVEFMSANGPVKITWDRFCDEGYMYFLNTDHIEYHRRPRSGWVKDDIGGDGYLRVAGEDAFEARFATYGQIFIAPTFHGVITGLTT